MSLLTYKYYDTPEGQDIFKKTLVTTKYAILASLPVATFDVLLYSHPKGIFQTVMRYGFYLGPAISMATAFTLTTNIAQNVRGKNDEFNYFLGGAAAGAVYASVRRQPVIAVPAAIVLGACGIVKKIGIDNNFTFFPKLHSGKESINSVRRDWTFVKDIDELKNWEKGSN
ncbi:NADH dehydrogenase [ubiquinone] 1 alpha subcomplex subunit 11 [Pieris napi]|uniref:NADH dehydrogenase [ubiquinone] 1 alpha subcomplex subunit 11 n=1 Tax=Pieris napi TaxID=78633 RepID=UPI001FBAFA67|nr:NADH dehydrogenase [ubiquinone] 1 alpha subcomplex subunit 11 [Pieris napi]